MYGAAGGGWTRICSLSQELKGTSSSEQNSQSGKGGQVGQLSARVVMGCLATGRMLLVTQREDESWAVELSERAPSYERPALLFPRIQ